jgi:hypothetical protein
LGLIDIATKQFINQDAVLSDVINYKFFDGAEVVKPEDLTKFDSTLTAVIRKHGKLTATQKTRDGVRRVSIQTPGGKQDFFFCIVGVEDQTQIVYDMVPRCILYDGITYDEELNEIYARNVAEEKAASAKTKATKGGTATESQDNAKNEELNNSVHDEAKSDDLTEDGSGDSIEIRIERPFTSRLRKNQLLTPVITVVVYYGDEVWDAPMTLKGVLNLDHVGTLYDYIPDYKIALLCPAQMNDEDLAKFKSDMRKVMKVAKCKNDSDAFGRLVNSDPDFEDVQNATVNVIESLTGLDFEAKRKKVVPMATKYKNIATQLEERAKIALTINHIKKYYEKKSKDPQEIADLYDLDLEFVKQTIETFK